VKYIILAVTAFTLAWRAEAQIYDTNNDVVQLFAGSGTSGFLNAQGTLAMFASPSYVVSDTQSNLFVCDYGNRLIRKITPDGTVSTFASVNWGTVGGMAIDGNNTIWITSGYGIYEVGSNGSVTFLSYSGVTGQSGICTDSENNIYYTAGNQIFRISAYGVLTLLAGNTSAGSTDANGTYASFSSPSALAADQAGNVYVWDTGNRKIRRIDASQNVTTIAGNGSSSDVDGVGMNASFGNIYSMISDNQGNIIMACGSSIRKMTAATNVVTMAGSFSQNSYANGAGSLARFYGASGVCLSQGMVFVADSNNQRVRQISFNPQPQIVSPANLALKTYAGLTITGLVGRTYQIQSSPDMNTWSTRATILLTSSPYLWFDLNPVSGNNYYRAILLP
jgi:sugar lactone lactonase YvrE